MSGSPSGDNNKPALPTIITTQDATPLADDGQQPQLNSSEESPSQTVTPSNSGLEPGSPSGSPGSVPNIAISTTAPAARSSAAASASHGRNYSISSLGHGRTPSLGSAAAHLQVPQSPSQGTVSLAGGGGGHHNPHTAIPPSPTLSVISDDNSPTASTARTHDRIPSVSSSAGFSSDPGHGPGMGSHARGKVGKLHSDDGSTNGPGTRRAGKHDDDDDCADEIDHPAKGIKGLKQRLYAHTRAGRIKAQEAKMEEERRQAREMDPTPFRHRPYEFADLVDPKSPKLLKEIGGTAGLVARLGSDPHSGLNLALAASANGAESEKVQEIERGEKDPENVPVQQHEDYVKATQEDRERVYGKNALPERKSKSLLLLMWLAFQDKILILLTIAAVVSLALGLYTDFGAATEYISCNNPPPGLPGCPAPKVDWVEGVAIIVAILIVDLVGSLNDYQKERQFAKLNAKKEERNVKVIRQGKQALMSVHDVLVGDVLMLEP
ncbi:plasma membrane calcium, partial [Tilletia horrida]